MKAMWQMTALVLTGCAALSGREADRVALAEARPVGEASDCVTLSSIRSTRVRDERTIDFMLNNGRVYRNRLPNSCPGLGFEQAFMYDTGISRLCSVDTITVLDNGRRRGATCGLGAFQPIELPPAR